MIVDVELTDGADRIKQAGSEGEAMRRREQEEEEEEVGEKGESGLLARGNRDKAGKAGKQQKEVVAAREWHRGGEGRECHE